ncbi:iron ABC transporter substrate-binding protein [Bacteroidia bacterium]|nr:iron ABC transporter substrate-binding protein [Bacteroidia bacterium]GHT84969.1 iron ABC transporter substrate-binding protein [Bacteroidia bacterium]GHV70218.1 iron ABC transporter substrate-binding protein [Bacteroidia bacterium]
MAKYLFLILSFCLLLFSCRNNKQEIKSEYIANQAYSNEYNIAGDSIYYAVGFQIETHTDYRLVTVRNPWNMNLVLQRYVLVSKTAALPENLPEGVLIRTPLERTVSYGSVQCSFFAEFGALPTLVGVCEPQYIHIPYVQEGVHSGRIADIGQGTNPDLEKIMLAEPEALFTAPIDGSGYGQTAKLGIPFIECMDYMESSPLGRAEWIRFMALFFEKKDLADSLFRETVDNYNQLKELSAQVNRRPSVFAETIYSGVWYLPGGQSYMAHIFRDSGADYLWKDDTGTGSIGLSFESVLDKADKADFWLIKYNNPQDMSYESLKKNNPNYAFFDAFKHRNIYACNMGKVTYYEDLPIHPDYILKDLVGLFHPELLPDYQAKYYNKMR